MTAAGVGKGAPSATRHLGLDLEDAGEPLGGIGDGLVDERNLLRRHRASGLPVDLHARADQPAEDVAPKEADLDSTFHRSHLGAVGAPMNTCWYLPSSRALILSKASRTTSSGRSRWYPIFKLPPPIR